VSRTLRYLRLYNIWAAPLVITALVLGNLVFWIAS